ncbi:hypothetical protein I6I45_10300 [Pseudomonas fluorescens]|nr:hypothetical protein I6I45_10300 [Pseudomonas fluorescens]
MSNAVTEPALEQKVCALCSEEHELQDSHLLPKHFYRYMEKMKKKGTKIQLKNNKDFLLNLTRQITQYLLGVNCEQRFSKCGEAYFSTLIFPRSGEVPAIYKHLKGLKDSNLYGSDVPSLDAKQLYYFALSIVWRAAQPGWPSYTSISLPEEDLSDIKKFLLSDGASEYPFGYCVELSISPVQSKVCTASFPQATVGGNIFFNFASVEFHVVKNPYVFDVYSHPRQGGVPIIYKKHFKRSQNFSASLINSYEQSNAVKNVVRLGQDPEETES